LFFAGLLAGTGPRPPAIRQAGAVNLTGRTVDAAAARSIGTIGHTAVHAEENAAAMSLTSHRLSPQGR
jgi:enoyl-CoA hydratase/carnithine racemase